MKPLRQMAVRHHLLLLLEPSLALGGIKGYHGVHAILPGPLKSIQHPLLSQESVAQGEKVHATSRNTAVLPSLLRLHRLLHLLGSPPALGGMVGSHGVRDIFPTPDDAQTSTLCVEF